MTKKRSSAAAAVLACAALLPGAGCASEWNFSVFLDDKPIGEHRFSVTGPAEARKVLSEAGFAVKLLGLTVYRYRHVASEQWRGDCLAALQAETDDDGKTGKVVARPAGDALEVDGPSGTLSLPGCAMSFAYWHPAMRTQTQLLNAQTGRYEAVRVRRMDSGTVEVRGQPQPAERWRIEGPEQPVDVWYAPSGAWIGLDSTVAGGRLLRYRLR